MGEALLRPPRLKPGATICLIAPSSMSTAENIAAGVRVYEKEGFTVRLGECVRKMLRHHFFSAPLKVRLREFHQAFLDDDIDAVFCIRGGIGAQRLLPHLDMDLVRDHPKILMGYSDITALHVALHQRTGLVTFHGPSGGVATSGREKDVEKRRQNLRDALIRLQDDDVWGNVGNPEDGRIIRTIREGRGDGRLHGGNLTLIANLMGTPWEIDLKDSLFFFEGVHLTSYAVWRYLVQLEMAGMLDEVRGVVVGEFSDRPTLEEAAPSIEEVLLDVLSGLKVPVIEGVQCGHGAYRVVLPVGAKASMEAEVPSLRVEEKVLD